MGELIMGCFLVVAVGVCCCFAMICNEVAVSLPSRKGESQRCCYGILSGVLVIICLGLVANTIHKTREAIDFFEKWSRNTDPEARELIY